MRKIDLLMLTALTAAPLMGNDLQTLADALTVQNPASGAKKLEMPVIPGAEIRILGADYEHIIDKEGNIRPVIEDTPVHVSFEVQKGDEKVVSRDYLLTIPSGVKTADGANPKPTLIPEILSWHGDTGVCKLPDTVRVRCGAPFAEQFMTELAEVARQATGRSIRVIPAGQGEDADITFDVEQCGLGSEGYAMNISPDGVSMTAESDKGLFWATRTLLQLVSSGKGSLPCGKIEDAPRFGLRGFMLDIARGPVPMHYLRGLVKTMAWYKMNELHLTLNNNYIFHEDYVDLGQNPFDKSYTAFRLESDVKGADGTPLTAGDLAYSKAEFMEFIEYARKHNITIVPEFDTPGHALSFTRIRPDLIYQGPMGSKAKRRCEMIDAANPEALKFVGEVFDEYLKAGDGKKAVFADCGVIHVGADEFFGAAEDYRKFADGLLEHVQSRGYTPRIWGSLNTKKGTTPVRAKGVQMNLWNDGWAKAWDSVQQGYDVINTNDGALYIVPEANYYRMDLNHRWVYNTWKPNVIGPETIPAGHPQLLGCTFAIWQDMIGRRYNGYSIYDIAGMVRDSIQVVGTKAWSKHEPSVSFEIMKQKAKEIGMAPGENLNMTKLSRPLAISVSTLPMQLNQGTIMPGYHMTMELELPEAPRPGEEQVLLESPFGKLMAAMKDASIGLQRSDARNFSFGVKLPVGKRVKLELIATCTPMENAQVSESKNLLILEKREVTLMLDGQPCGKFELQSECETIEDINTNVMLPLDVLGGSFKGKVYNLTITPTNQK
ncbi:MAG: family 20 glycosylhydrolase [Akkermansia sp.]|nr:family 20 glycosylhydrolase [Akkermansia sp.]